MVAILHYLAICPSGDGLLFALENSSPLTREYFVREVKATLRAAQNSHQGYSGHSFRIGAGTAAAEAGVPVHIIKMLGRLNLDTYMLYIHTARETLAAISQWHSEIPTATCPRCWLLSWSLLSVTFTYRLFVSVRVRLRQICFRQYIFPVQSVGGENLIRHTCS